VNTKSLAPSRCPWYTQAGGLELDDDEDVTTGMTVVVPPHELAWRRAASLSMYEAANCIRSTTEKMI
jgi:hypothetical protein